MLKVFILLGIVGFLYIDAVEFDFFNEITRHKIKSKRLNSRILSNRENELFEQWKQSYNESVDSARHSIANEVIDRAAGIYRDPDKTRRFGTQKTILVNVVSYNKETTHIKYNQMLTNWFCFANHYGLRPLTYLVPAEGINFTTQVEDLHSIGVIGEFITYPNELFWSLITNRTQGDKHLAKGFGKVDYTSKVPSFQHFGALVMLVPIYEVLLRGYDVIYIDLDVGFVHDPIPYLVKNNVEFSISNEMKTCYCPSVKTIAVNTDWHLQEPNTGIMRVRSTPASLEIFRVWLKRNIDENVSNDQKVLDLINFGAFISFDCNEQLQPLSDQLIEKYNQSLKPYQRVSPSELPSKPRYCFLNEYFFQNGKIALHCSQNRHGNAAEYLRAMDQNNFTVWNDTLQSYEKTLAPAVIHMNFCDDKVAELEKFGMWLPSHSSLYHSTICKQYRYEDTFYGKTNWDAKLKSANEELSKIEKMIYNGSVVKLHRWPHMYMYYEGKFRVFPNGETLEAMGLDWKQVHYPGPYNMLKAIPPGDPLPDLKNYTNKR